MATILVVEDEPDMLFLLGMVLRRAGYEVVEAPHGAAALERLEESQPDLVVTDLMMPVMDGGELIARLRADPKTEAIPILLVSANPNHTAGADAILRKPFDPDELLERIRTVLQGGQ